MSTNLSHGYKSSMKISPKWNSWWSEFAPKLIAKREILMKKDLAELAVKYYDQHQLKGEAEEDFIEKARNTFKKDFQDSKNGQNTSYDYDFSITLHPIRGGTLLLRYCSNLFLTRMFDNEKHVERFQYWNGTDGPDDMSHKEWRHRGEIWDKALNNKAPIMSGMTFALPEAYVPFIRNEDLKQLESRDLRKPATDHALNTLVDKYSSKPMKSPGEMVSLMWEIKDGEIHQEEYQELIESNLLKLKPELNRDILENAPIYLPKSLPHSVGSVVL